MKKLIVFLCIICVNIFAIADSYTTEDEQALNDYEITTLRAPNIQFVSTDDGSNLNYRAEPVNGQKLGSFPNGTKLKITKMTYKRFEVDGIKENWFYATNMVNFTSGWVFGGYLTSFDPKKRYLKKNEINLDYLVGDWEDTGHSFYIKNDGRFFFGLKESEGFGGTWSIRWDSTLYVADCQVYDEEPSSAEYKIKICEPNRLVLVSCWDGKDYEYDLRRIPEN